MNKYTKTSKWKVHSVSDFTSLHKRSLNSQRTGPRRDLGSTWQDFIFQHEIRCRSDHTLSSSSDGKGSNTDSTSCVSTSSSLAGLHFGFCKRHRMEKMVARKKQMRSLFPLDHHFVGCNEAKQTEKHLHEEVPYFVDVYRAINMDFPMPKSYSQVKYTTKIWSYHSHLAKTWQIIITFCPACMMQILGHIMVLC